MKVQIRRERGKGVWRYGVYRITSGGAEIFEDFTLTLAAARRVVDRISSRKRRAEIVEEFYIEEQ